MTEEQTRARAKAVLDPPWTSITQSQEAELTSFELNAQLVAEAYLREHPEEEQLTGPYRFVTGYYPDITAQITSQGPVSDVPPEVKGLFRLENLKVYRVSIEYEGPVGRKIDCYEPPGGAQDNRG